MHEQFDKIERDLKAAIEAGRGDQGALLDRLERLLNDVRGARFSTRFALFGADMKPGGQTVEDGDEQSPRKFGRDVTVRTPEGYLARVVGYDKRGKVVVNVVFEACEYTEADLRETSL